MKTDALQMILLWKNLTTWRPQSFISSSCLSACSQSGAKRVFLLSPLRFRLRGWSPTSSPAGLAVNWNLEGAGDGHRSTWLREEGAPARSG